MVISIISLLIFILLFEQCSVHNLRNAFVLKKKEYLSLPYLKDTVESENYCIKYISTNYTKIYYHPSHLFFMLIGNTEYIKLDAKGKQAYSIERNDSMHNPFLCPYVFTQNSVYDFTENELVEVPFEEVVNAEQAFEELAWEKEMDNYYKLAQVVIYGEEYSSVDGWGFPVYFKIDSNWIKLVTPKGWVRSANFDGLEFRYKQYPAKFDHMVLLKDPKLNEYSDNTGSNIGSIFEDKTPYLLTYSTKFKIKRQFYQKEMICDYFPYTHIPNSWTGTACYRLKMKGDVLKFKEHTIKPVFNRVQDYFFWYILPNKYQNDSQVSFIEYSYPVNINESGSKGLYILVSKE